MTPEILMLEIGKLQESKTNPRTTFDKQAMAELAADIKEHGVLQPLIVRSLNGAGTHEIVFGSRRFKAAKLVGLKQVPCIPRTLTDEQVLELQLVENLQREDVHPAQEATGFKRLHDMGYTIEQIAAKVNKEPWYIQRGLKYNDLIEPVRKMFLAGDFGATIAILVARLQPDQQKQTIPWIKRGESANGLNEEIVRHFFLVLKDAPFDPTDAKLVPQAGTCTGCPKRTGFNKLLFPDIKDADTCTDPECFETKTRAFVKIQVGTHPDAVLLSIGDPYSRFAAGNGSKKPKGITAWVRAGDKNCPDTKEGILVEQLQHWQPENQKAKIGQVLKVCTNPVKCKTHGERAEKRSSDYDSRTGGSKSAMKARKIELRRRGLIFKELAADSFNLHAKDYREMLDHRIAMMGADEARAVCYAMEWEIKEASYGGKDFQGTIEKNLAKLTGEAVYQWLYLLTLAETDLWFYTNTTVSKPKSLEAKAKEAGVPLADIAKLSKEKPKAAAKPKAKAAKK